ncbi:barstar family protein [Nonomuraea basaltis]|uniref:barstar family protein n=1 Tax=Nonomuraea basaltis TaxID=2495887 RepID=UPI001486A692|nr:barstar family protein [Nonomuraea basaltis]
MADVKYKLRAPDAVGSILEFADMDGFFVGNRSSYENFERPDETPSYRLSLAVHGLKTSPEWEWHYDEPLNLPGDVNLEILNEDGNSIGGYDLWNVKIALASPGACAGNVQATVSWLPHAGARSVWESWRVAPPADTNQWWSIPIGRREGWVEVARISRISVRPVGRGIVLDGRGIVDLASFFCAIGEAVHGPGGYFGSNFMALFDCLRRLPRADGSPVHLRWLDFAVAERHLSRVVDTETGPARYIDIVLETLSDADVAVILE